MSGSACEEPRFGRARGISALIASQNSERTICASVSSFACQCDEVIVVDNGSTDKTLDILDYLDQKFANVTVMIRPDIHHLHENRQVALESSHYQWVVRADSDWVLSASAMDANAVSSWRNEVLRATSNAFVWSRSLTNINYVCNRFLARNEEAAEYISKYVPPRFTSYRWRILRYSPMLRFVRNGRWESVSHRYIHAALERPIPSVYIAHYEFKSDMDFFLRSERTNWRETGNFCDFPTLDSYVRRKYSVQSRDALHDAAREYVTSHIYPALAPVTDAGWEPPHSQLLR